MEFHKRYKKSTKRDSSLIGFLSNHSKAAIHKAFVNYSGINLVKNSLS